MAKIDFKVLYSMFRVTYLPQKQTSLTNISNKIINTDFKSNDQMFFFIHGTIFTSMCPITRSGPNTFTVETTTKKNLLDEIIKYSKSQGWRTHFDTLYIIFRAKYVQPSNDPYYHF